MASRRVCSLSSFAARRTNCKMQHRCSSFRRECLLASRVHVGARARLHTLYNTLSRPAVTTGNARPVAPRAADGEASTQATQQMLKEGRDEATQFDVRRATLLGQCAFEAYGEPAGSGVKESSVNGTSTTYIDKSYVAESFAGILEITLQGGEDLRGPDALRQAAVQVYCGRSFTKSEPRGGTSPNWGGAKLRVYVGRGETRLRVRGVTTGVMGNNLIGDAFIDLTELRGKMEKVGRFSVLQLPVEEIVTLRGPKGEAGRLRLNLKLFQFDPTLLWEPPRAFTELLKRLPFATREEEMETGWQALASKVREGFLVPKEYRPIAFVENEETDTQVWIYRDAEFKEVVVSFRGTEQVKWKDFLTDLRLSPVELDIERAGRGGGALGMLTSVVSGIRGSGKAAEEDTVLVHGGFLEAYDSVKDTVNGLVDDLVGAQEGWKVLVTGHSLGGALATLSALDLAKRAAPEGKPKYEVDMYNFGSPRVGNVRFAADFNASVPRTFRVTNARDIICTVPKLLGYCHVGCEVRIGSDGSLTIGGRQVLDGQESFQLAERLTREFLGGIVDEFKAGGVEQMSRQQLEDIIREEMDILRNLADGSALSEHMEDCYLGALQLALVGQVSGKEQE